METPDKYRECRRRGRSRKLTLRPSKELGTRSFRAIYNPVLGQIIRGSTSTLSLTCQQKSLQSGANEARRIEANIAKLADLVRAGRVIRLGGEGQKSECASGKAGGRRGLGPLSFPPRSLRLAMMAASLAAAAALGSFVGSLSAGSVTQLWPRVSSSVAASETQAPNAELAELSALKTYVEGAGRNTNNQFTRLADRLDRIERAQAEPNAKLARIADAVDRLEKERKSAVAATAAPAAAAPETTVS